MRTAAARLGAETLGAGRSVLRLLRFDPAWAESLDLSTDGFLRSFWAPALALPLSIVTLQAWARVEHEAAPSLPATVFAGLVDALLYPLLLALIARPTGTQRGYAAYVILANWAGFFVNLAMAVAALPLLALGHAPDAFSFAARALTMANLYALWRAGRETIGRDAEGPAGFAPVLMVVVLAVGTDAFCNQLAAWLSG